MRNTFLSTTAAVTTSAAIGLLSSFNRQVLVLCRLARVRFKQVPG